MYVLRGPVPSVPVPSSLTGKHTVSFLCIFSVLMLIQENTSIDIFFLFPLFLRKNLREKNLAFSVPVAGIYEYRKHNGIAKACKNENDFSIIYIPRITFFDTGPLVKSILWA